MSVLNLQVAMKPALFEFLVIISLLFPSWSRQDQALPQIISPVGGEALQGMVTVFLEMDPAQTHGYELSYAYQAGLNETWFLIVENQISGNGMIQTVWDTTTISDGTYRLKLNVYFNSGLTQEVFVDGLRVRNYSVIETSTPTSTPVITVTQIPSTATLALPTQGIPTSFPENPLQVNQSQLWLNIKQGFLGVAGIFALMGIYGTIYKISRKRKK